MQGRAAEVLAERNFIAVVPPVLRNTTLQVRQSAFALVGDCARFCIDPLRPFLPEIIPLCATALREHTSATVSNNASWAIGEICVKVGEEYMAPFMEDVLQALISVLQRLESPPEHEQPDHEAILNRLPIRLGIDRTSTPERPQKLCLFGVRARRFPQKSERSGLSRGGRQVGIVCSPS